MRIDEFDYDLPVDRIAQVPAAGRAESRLLVAVRGRSDEHRRFSELPELLVAGDLLVLNDARVVPARVVATGAGGGGVELLFLGAVRRSGGRTAADQQAGEGPPRWRALARPAKRVRIGDRLTLPAEGAWVRVVALGDRGERVVEFAPGIDPVRLLEAVGEMPLPPYIDVDSTPGREALDRERYQTVYAACPGAVAAPTAGLHFTTELLARLRATDVEIAVLTLHVGPGTFRPVVAEHVEDHVMDGEAYSIPPATADAVNRATRAGRRVIAVGTTAARTLEYAAVNGRLPAANGVADSFIYPGYRFRIVDGMITNFHLPRSTPLLLVAALLGRERLMRAYQTAIDTGYRFYSYGDAMLVLP